MRKLSSLPDRLRPTSVAAQCLISIVVRPASGVARAAKIHSSAGAAAENTASSGRWAASKPMIRTPIASRSPWPTAVPSSQTPSGSPRTPAGTGLELGLFQLALVRLGGLVEALGQRHLLGAAAPRLIGSRASRRRYSSSRPRCWAAHRRRRSWRAADGGAAGDDLDGELAGVRAPVLEHRGEVGEVRVLVVLDEQDEAVRQADARRSACRRRPADGSGAGSRPAARAASWCAPRASGAQALELAGDLAADPLEPAGVLEGQAIAGADHEQRRAPEVAAGALLLGPQRAAGGIEAGGRRRPRRGRRARGGIGRSRPRARQGRPAVRAAAPADRGRRGRSGAARPPGRRRSLAATNQRRSRSAGVADHGGRRARCGRAAPRGDR
jgi:hypothetical protein